MVRSRQNCAPPIEQARDIEPAAVESRHRDLEALPFLADQVVRRHAAILEHHHRGRLRFPAELLLLRAEGQTGRALLDHDAGNAFRSRLAGAHHADIDVGHPAAGDEGLGAVEHIMIAVAPRAWSQGSRHPSPRPARSGNSSRNAPWCRASAESACAAARRRRRRSSRPPCCGWRCRRRSRCSPAPVPRR